MTYIEPEDPKVLTALGKIVTRLDIVIDFLNIIEYLMPAPAGEPASLVLTTGPVTTQGAPNMQIHDNEQFDIKVDAVDSKGVPTADTFTTTVDNAAVVTLVVGADSKTFTIIAGLPGSAIITITDGTLSVTEAVDVVAGAVAKISVTEGPVSVQAPPAPPAPVA